MGVGPFSSSSDTRTRVNNVNSSVNQAEGAYAYTPRIATSRGNVQASVTQSGIAVTGKGNSVSVVTTDFGSIQAAAAILDRTLQSQANSTLQAIGMSKELAETKISDGANITSKTVRIAILALAAIVLVFFIFRRSG